jgi:alpha-tubulin suppressor-like RCC1 family protein
VCCTQKAACGDISLGCDVNHTCQPCITQVAALDSHTCALRVDGFAECWGANESGELGDGSKQASPVPVTVMADATTPLGNLVQIATGGGHSCALARDGTAYCWGFNNKGQIGTDVTATPTSTRPVKVAGAYIQIATGGFHSCGIHSDGQVVCWGSGAQNQVGQNGGPFDNPDPTVVPGVTGAVSLALGYQHSCARLSDGTMLCWGFPTDGELGYGSTSAPVPAGSAVAVLNSPGSLFAASGWHHTCLISSTHGLLCWGADGTNQLGDGKIASNPTPQSVLGNVLGVAGGQSHTCAVLTDNSLSCWGLNASGQLGDGTMTQRGTPHAIPSLPAAFKQVTAGSSHSCALTTGGQVYCWGDNSKDQLGTGDANPSSSPKQSMASCF